MNTHRHRPAISFLIALAFASAIPAQEGPAEIVERVLREVPLIDGHNDLPWQYRTRVDNHLSRIDLRDTTLFAPPMHTDLSRLEKSGIGGQFWSVYIPASLDGAGAAATVLEQIDVVVVVTHRNHPGVWNRVPPAQPFRRTRFRDVGWEDLVPP